MALGLTSAQAQSTASQQDEKTLTNDIPHVVAASNQDKQWRPSAEQQKRVVRDALTYLAAKDARNFAEAYALFSPIQKSAVPFDRWEADMKAFYSGSGTADGRTLKKVTWYKNPANAPLGIYAAVDF